MSDPRSGGKGHSGCGNDPSLAKTAGFLVFSGIALSILKTLNPFNKNRTESPSESLAGPAQPIREVPPPSLHPPQPHSPREPIVKKQTSTDQFVTHPSQPAVEIVKGDTLWGLSQKYGVSASLLQLCLLAEI
ncbi:hypothetical protein SAY87_027267 [Trapa incisa]|uniref:LysM domain-containing protein n=1 Tax=Trapa incisa TaxID=236973 RepID=A0AAN7GT73_9MYRT|nr:hypothetical protein SAY87_027267 [Trapa incisa]